MNQKLKFFFENWIEIVLSMPKILYFNLRVLPFSIAIKLPFMISYHVKIKNVNRKNFIIENVQQYSFASMRIGFGGSNCGYRESKKGLIAIEGEGKIIIKGRIAFSRGIIIEACDGEIIFGENFRCNYSTSVYCKESSITFGDNVVLGWCVSVKNGDGHYIIENGLDKAQCAPIIIGNHVWICSYSHVLKGVRVNDNCVVAYRALLTKGSMEEGVIYAGCPAQIIRREIDWRE